MSEFSRAPKFWSDFDGTAVQLRPKSDPRNWIKYPLPLVRGYVDFIEGVKSTSVEMSGVVSRRTTMPGLLRQQATERSMKKLGISNVFGKDAQVVLAGSEERKARYLAEESLYDRVGMIDDKPHKLGSALVKAQIELDMRTALTLTPILLGVVAHEKTEEYLARLAEAVDAMDGVERGEALGITGLGMSIETENTRLDVVRLMPYSFESGQTFGRLMAV